MGIRKHYAYYRKYQPIQLKSLLLMIKTNLEYGYTSKEDLKESIEMIEEIELRID